MKKKTKKSLKQLCKESEGGKPEPLTTEHYFSSPIYFTDKPAWVKGFNTASDAYIKQARLNNLDMIKKRNTMICKEIRPKGSMVIFPSFVWHRVKPVTKGSRYSLVIWNLGRPFQ